MMRRTTSFGHPIDVPYHMFKQAVVTLHQQKGKHFAADSFAHLSIGMQLLSELGELFPAHAARLADDPEFLS